MNSIESGSEWKVYPGNERTTLALPDYYSTYLAYTVDVSRHPNLGLCISGAYPQARYMSFNIYASRSGTSLGSFSDYQIRPLPNNINPFIAGNGSIPSNSSYSIQVLPKSFASNSGNQLLYDPDQLQPYEFTEKLLSVIIRYYVPADSERSVPHPTVVAFDAESQDKPLDPQPRTYPTFLDLNEPIFKHRLKPIFQTLKKDEPALSFLHTAGGGQFNNADNLYLIAAVANVDGHDNVVMLKLKAPTYPNNSEELDQTSVRYWSINQGDPSTSTPMGMHDSQFRTARDGFTYVVMGGDEVRVKADAGGYNYMPWLANKEKAVIVYRNMLTNPQYRGCIARVPLFHDDHSSEIDLKPYEAYQTLGDYAPVGQKVTSRAFNENFAGWPAPGFMS